MFLYVSLSYNGSSLYSQAHTFVDTPSALKICVTLPTGVVGQSEWSEFFPDCGGFIQSPIDVDTSQTWYDPSLSPIRPLGYDQHGHEPFALSNNGHTGNPRCTLFLIHNTHS